MREICCRGIRWRENLLRGNRWRDSRLARESVPKESLARDSLAEDDENEGKGLSSLTAGDLDMVFRGHGCGGVCPAPDDGAWNSAKGILERR